MECGVLDTSVLIAEGLEPIPGRLAISVLSMAGLQFGILVAKTSDARTQRLARVTALQRRFDPLPVDDAVVESYGRLAARVVETGRQPRSRVLDLMFKVLKPSESSSWTRAI